MKSSSAMVCEILTAGDPTVADIRLLSMIRFWGIRARFSTVPFKELDLFFENRDNSSRHLVATADTIKKIFTGVSDASTAASLFRDFPGSLFVIGIDSGHDDTIRWLLGNDTLVCRDLPPGCGQLQVEEGLDELTGSLSGAEFGLPPSSVTTVGWFEGFSGPEVRSVISAGDRPVYLILSTGSNQMHLVAVGDILDLDETTCEGFDLSERIVQFAPVVMYLRQAFGDAVWHVPRKRGAVTIDDPSLMPTHGYLDYQRLQGTLENTDSAATIGFIPINSDRTSPEVAEIFRDAPDRLSICVHGCFHSPQEFRVEEASKADRLALTALMRLQRLEVRTGVPFTKIMVFPYGIFTREALRSLRRMGYSAAVNTHLHPQGLESNELTMADHVGLAMVSDDGVALFPRHTVHRSLATFQLQAFLGQPVIITAHHHICRSEDKPFTDLVNNLRRVIRGLKWVPLGDAIEHGYLQRLRPGGRVQCLIFTNEAVIYNDSDLPRTYTVMRRELKTVPVVRARVADHEVPFRRIGGFTVISSEVAPSDRVEVRLETATPSHTDSSIDEMRPTPSGRVRRRLCEIRDALIALMGTIF